jgi:3-oxoadipate enol-lactonase
MSAGTPRDSAFVLQRAGCPLHYWLDGPEGRPLVVFTHGAWLDHTAFAEQVALVVRAYRVLSWDVRAHGRSRPTPTFTIRAATTDLVALLDHLGYAQAILVGHSMGGNIAQEVVFLHPTRVRALVLVGCTCNTLPLSRRDASTRMSCSSATARGRARSALPSRTTSTRPSAGSPRTSS